MIEFYNEQSLGFVEKRRGDYSIKIEDYISDDETKIKWVQNLIRDAEKGVCHSVDMASFRVGSYRPFSCQNIYFNKYLNWSRYRLPSIFPYPGKGNLIICASGVGAQKEFSVLMTSYIPDLQLVDKAQCFPLYYYEPAKGGAEGLFEQKTEDGQYVRRDGVSDYIWNEAKRQYAQPLTKEDIFYYVYGYLHSPDYRTKFAYDLKKMLPRLPLVESFEDFWAFSQAGRQLADLHVNYESVPPHPGLTVTGAESGHYRVEKMRFPARKDTIHYNSAITVSNIPAEAYEYVVNGKSAIEWVMDRYAITTHKESQITNDPNDWADEVGNPRYILDLLLSVIHLSVQTVAIVKGLPSAGV